VVHKQNRVVRLKSKIFPPKNILVPQNFGLATLVIESSPRKFMYDSAG